MHSRGHILAAISTAPLSSLWTFAICGYNFHLDLAILPVAKKMMSQWMAPVRSREITGTFLETEWVTTSLIRSLYESPSFRQRNQWNHKSAIDCSQKKMYCIILLRTNEYLFFFIKINFAQFIQNREFFYKMRWNFYRVLAMYLARESRRRFAGRTGRVKSRLAISFKTNYHGWTWIRDVNLNDVAATAAIRARSRRWHYRRSRSFLLLFSLYARTRDACRPFHARTSQRCLLSCAPFESEHRFNQFASVTASLRVKQSA